jgi:hypothetical protein
MFGTFAVEDGKRGAKFAESTRGAMFGTFAVETDELGVKTTGSTRGAMLGAFAVETDEFDVETTGSTRGAMLGAFAVETVGSNTDALEFNGKTVNLCASAALVECTPVGTSVDDGTDTRPRFGGELDEFASKPLGFTTGIVGGEESVRARI